MKKLTKLLFSMRLMSVVILLFAIIMAVATFVENDFGTTSSKAVIYNAWWFELIMLLLAINFVGNIFQYKLYRKEKWPVFIFHIAFIITLFGAFITRYFGYEGVMAIREGEVSEIIISEQTYFNVLVQKGSEEKNLEKEVMYGPLHNSNFRLKQKIGDVPFKIEYLNYYMHAKPEFVQNMKGEEHLHLIISGDDGRKDIYIPNQKSIEFGEQTFTYNKQIPDAMNFVKTDTGISFRPAQEGTFLDMNSKDTTVVFKDSLVPAQLMTLYRFNKLHFVVPENAIRGEQKLVSAPKREQNVYPLDALFVKVTSGSESKNVYLYGGKHIVGESQNIELNGLKFTLNYGSKSINIPFGVKLRDFQMERYPGTNSASSYASEVTVIDKDKVFDFRIFMNHVLDYKGYRFFQSSFDSDELGTVLQVNHDFWGTLITYIGYFFMGIGMFFTLFWKGSRFSVLSDKLKKLSQENAVLLMLFSVFSLNVYSQEMPRDTVDPHKHIEMPKVGEDKLLNIVDRKHADKFGKLLIQDHQGRIKPVNTYALEALRKVYKKDFYKGLSAEQVLLSGQLDPYYWEGQYLIHVKSKALGEKASSALEVFEGYTSISKFFENDHETYYLQNLVAEANQKKNMDRTSTDKEIINLDERFNVLVSIFNGDFVKLYPKIGDAGNKWYAGMDQELMMSHDAIIPKLHRAYLGSLVEAVQTGDYSKADENLERISAYQLKNGASIIPSSAKIDLEVKYNQWNIFKKLMMHYMLIGFLLLIVTFVKLFTKESKILKKIITVLSIATVMGMVFHLFGLSARAYISGHAPWSNGYEAIVFVAFISVLAGFIFSYKKSKFPLASTVIFSSFLLGIAHGSMMNPEITNLVPVLKSYWLMIHVAIITSSYGFLGLGALLGFVVLLLYILRTPDNQKKINRTIDELSYVNESALIIGLFTLTIGTFLGGVWANESWGRYWSWDPKEVWSLISMMVYIFVLHMRLVPGLRGKFALNLASMFAISTLIMTFFGVNFYLSGMHSYATGDPVPIPNWIYIAVLFFVVFSIISYLRYKKLED